MNAVTPLPLPPSGSRINLRSSTGLGWNGFGAALLGISAGSTGFPPCRITGSACMSARR